MEKIADGTLGLSLPRLINGDYHVGTTSADEAPLHGVAV
jgi:hypothetical protein